MEISCLICGDGLKIRRHNVFSAVSDHSQTILFELIQKALGFELDSSIFESEVEKESICLCESCFGKINNYDLGISLCEKAQRELEQLLEEKIKKQDLNQSEERGMKVEELNVANDPLHFETLDAEIKNEIEPENDYEDEMEEEHLIDYDEAAFEQVEIRQSSESDAEVPSDNVEIKLRRPRSRKFTRAVEKGRFYCEICTAGYTTQEELDFHVEKHKDIPSNECPECHKRFAQKSALARHMPMHTGEKPYQCTVCGKRFIHYSSFNMHMLIHDDVRLKKCQVCGLALRSSSHLSRHMRVHTGEKPYACPTCGQKFAQRYNMNAHMKSHQGIKRMPNRATQCPLCTVSFRIKGKLKDHISRVHGQTVAVVEPSQEDSENGEGWVIIKEDIPQNSLKLEGVALLS